MVRGRLRITLSDESVLLDPGDAFTFPGREPHTWANATEGDEECEVVWVLAPAP